jgi:hypothetical protein
LPTLQRRPIVRIVTGMVLCIAMLATSAAHALEAERTPSRSPCCASMDDDCGAVVQRACCGVSDDGHEALVARAHVEFKPDQSIVAAAFFQLAYPGAIASRLTPLAPPLSSHRSTRLLASVFRI